MKRNSGKVEITKILRELGEKLPKFPDGRIDYSKSDIAPVITVFVKYRDKILLLKRSDKVSTYKGKWNTVAGYLDEIRPIEEKVLEELGEELGIGEENILSIRIADPFEFKDSRIGKTWIVTPVLIELGKEPEITLDWEHTDYTWIHPDELKNFDTVPNLDKSLERALAVRENDGE
ncbi:MAG: NUDIX domain-containing protein [Archaeoglobus sp.]|nr:NUDIX domain-containing protein [Archaeoglobus sp.]